MSSAAEFAAALALFQRGDLAGAERALRTLTARAPGDAQAVHLFAAVLHAKGDLAKAAEWFARAGALAPKDAAVAFNHGAALAAAKRHAEAVDAFARVLVLKRGDVQALLARGVSNAALRRHAEALADYDAALAGGFDRPELHANRASALAALGRYEDALAASVRAPADDVGVLFAKASSLQALERHEEALSVFDRLLVLRGDHLGARAGRATALASLGRAEEGLAEIDAVIARQPERVDHWSRRGYVLGVMNCDVEALTAYDRVLAATPDDADAMYARADVLLVQGDFEQGFAAYEARWRVRGAPPMPNGDAPVWLGAEPIEGKSVLLQWEQGFGDLFQFSRLASVLAARAGKVYLQERPQTLALMRSLGGVEVIDARAPAPRVDFRTPLMSLPLALGLRVENIPARIPYLSAPPEGVAHWAAQLGARARRRVGVCWTSGGRGARQFWRRLDRAALAGLLEAEADFVSLQYDVGAEKDLLRARGVRDFGAATADFAELAALISNLDLVITIDTGVAHLAGALGKPVWVMLPHHCDWRWMRERADTPWYPQARLFRQTRFGDWDGVIAAVHAAL
ncbi:MAG: tetratricopeptide repeat protein [Caulobacterales bacterium]|nr:tetratricopeptide repeat protein [Caulobacterales bacterium]